MLAFIIKDSDLLIVAKKIPRSNNLLILLPGVETATRGVAALIIGSDHTIPVAHKILFHFVILNFFAQ